MQIQCASYQRWSINSQRHCRREKRESKTRSEMSDLGHLCYHNAYTLWTDEDHQSVTITLVLQVYRLVLKVYRLKREGQRPLHGTQSLQTRREWVRGTEWNSRTHRVDWDKTDMTGIWVDQWVWQTHNDCLSGSGVGSHENRPLIRATMKKLMGLRPNTHNKKNTKDTTLEYTDRSVLSCGDSTIRSLYYKYIMQMLL